MKKIPYGIINFKLLIEEDYYYVDKTMYLEKLENVGKTLFYLRPGRFGKSLFTSVLYYYYDINGKDLYKKLFKETYVYQNPTKGKNNYYILKFDFSGINENKENEELIESFKACVILGINDFIDRYNIKYEYNKDIPADDMLKYFLNFIQGLKLEHKIYIIVDEYDNFTNAILEGSADKFIKIVTGTVKSFYANIKIFIKEGTVERFFATGICPITLDSMTTGFNIATDISTDIRFNSMIGLNHEEVKKLLDEIVLEKDREEIYNLMIKNYDGYLFNEEATERVFNATLTMYLLNYYEDFKKIPKELMDKNIVTNYGKIGKLLKLKENDYYNEIIDELLKNDEITGELQNNFNLELDISKNDLISLLYYFGYLTIGEDNFGLIKFKVPNKVMKEAYNNYFIELLKIANIQIDSVKIRDIIEEIVMENKIEKLNKYVEEILKLSDNRIFMKFDEKYIEVIYFSLLMKNNYFDVYTEYPNKNGYIDVYLKSKNELMKKNIMIELKYIKKKDYNEKLLKEKIKEGKSQLESYSKDERINNALKYLVVYVGNDLKILDLV